MSKLEERESRRRSSVIGSMVDGAPSGRPREDREIKKRVSLSVLPSLYEDIQKIAYVQRRSVSDIIGEQLMKYREQCGEELLEYARIKDNI